MAFIYFSPKYSASVDPSLIISANKSAVNWGGELTYNLQYTNNSGGYLAIFRLNNAVPANTEYVAGSASGKAIFQDNTLTWKTTLQSGQVFRASFKVKAKLALAPSPGDARAVIFAPVQANTGYKVSFDATQSLGKNKIGEVDNYGPENYTWDFGDNSPILDGPYNSMVSHAFSSAGSYTVSLTVRDSAGGVSTTSKTIQVSNLPRRTVSGFTDEAVTAAVESLGTNGIVHLPAGQYYFDHQVQIKEGIVIEGEGKDKTVISQPGSAGKAFTLGGDNTRLTNLGVRNVLADDTAWPVALEMSVLNRRPYKNFYVDNCEFQHLQQVVKGTSGTETNLSGASALFENNAIHNNDYAGLGYGFSSEMGSYTVARNNEFYTNRHSVEGGGRSGNSSNGYTYISYKSGYDLIGNTFHGPNSPRGTSSVDVAVDMHMGGRGRLRIVNNTFQDLKYGIGLHDGWGEIKGNTFRNIGYVNVSNSSYVIKLTKDYHNGFDGENCVDYLNPNLKGRAVCKGAFHFEIKDNNFFDNPAPNWYMMDFDALHPIHDIYINDCLVDSATYLGQGRPSEAGLICPMN